MIRNFSYNAKNGFLEFYKLCVNSSVAKALLEFVFPNFCSCCEEPSSHKFFCLPCWQLCSFPDTSHFCPVCFKDSQDVCWECFCESKQIFYQAFVFYKTAPTQILCTFDPDVLASFIIVYWASLDWLYPEVIFSSPDMVSISKSLSLRLNCPLVCISDVDPSDREIEKIEEKKVVLVLNRTFIPESFPSRKVFYKGAAPCKVYFLSLFSSFY